MKNFAIHAIIFLVLLAAIKSFAQTGQESVNASAAAKVLSADGQACRKTLSGTFVDRAF